MNNLLAYALVIVDSKFQDEPTSYVDAMKSKESKLWADVINVEMKYLLKNNAWRLMKMELQQNVVKCK